MEAPIAQSCALPGNAQGRAIGAFIGLYGQKRINSYLAPWSTWYDVGV